jgi:hypothetical protein
LIRPLPWTITEIVGDPGPCREIGDIGSRFVESGGVSMRYVRSIGRSWGLALAIALGAASVVYAQFGGAPNGAVKEFTHQEVQTALLVQTLNDLGKQNWEIFQVVPVWSITNRNGESELIPKAYQIFGRRTVAAK